MRNSFLERIRILEQNPDYVNIFGEITIEEKAAIQFYTDGFCYSINPFLRKQKTFDEEISTFLEYFSTLISSGLNKVEVPYTSYAHRGLALSTNILENLKKHNSSGTPVRFPGFTSATSLELCALDFADKAAYQNNVVPVVFNINSIKGVDISALSAYSGEEQEILFNKDSSFIIQYFENDGKRNYFDLIEV